jgi:hypothetical protein
VCATCHEVEDGPSAYAEFRELLHLSAVQYSTVAIAPTRGQRPLFPGNRNVLRNVRNSRYLGYWKAQFSYNDSVTFPWSEEFVIHAFESPDSAQAGT